MAKVKRCGLLGCDEVIIGFGKYCSTKCKQRAIGIDTTNKTKTIVSTVIEGKCYGRQAVECSQFNTRPEPLEPTDQPVQDNRGRYKRQDGTVYMFDCRGHSFECNNKRVDESGEVHMEVYGSVQDVRRAGDPDYTGTYRPIEISNV